MSKNGRFGPPTLSTSRSTSWFLIGAVLAQASLAFGAEGGGVRGVNDEVIRDRLVHEKANLASSVSGRAREIERLVRSGSLKRRVYAFFAQANPEKFLPEHQGDFSDRKTPRQTFEELVKLGAAKDTLASEFYTAGKCPNYLGIPRSAATDDKPGSRVCINPMQLARLEEDVDEADNTGAPGLHDDFLFAAGMHEIARHFGKDDSHDFMIAMLTEARNHFVVSDFACPPDSNLCGTGRLQYAPVFALDESISSQVYLRVRYEDKKLKSQDVDKCNRSNTLSIDVEKNWDFERRSLPIVSAEGQEVVYSLDASSLHVISTRKWLNTRAYDFNWDLPRNEFQFANLRNQESLDRNRFLTAKELPCGRVTVTVLNSVREPVVGPLEGKDSIGWNTVKFVYWSRPGDFADGQSSAKE